MFLPTISKRRGYFTDPKPKTKANPNMSFAETYENEFDADQLNKSFAKKSRRVMINVIPKRETPKELNRVFRSPLMGYSEWERKHLALREDFKKHVRNHILRSSRSSSPHLEKIKAYAYQSKETLGLLKIKTLINQRPEEAIEPAIKLPYKDAETQVTPKIVGTGFQQNTLMLPKIKRIPETSLKQPKKTPPKRLNRTYDEGESKERKKEELRQFLLKQIEEKKQRKEQEKLKIQQERIIEEKRIEEQKRQLLQAFGKELEATTKSKPMSFEVSAKKPVAILGVSQKPKTQPKPEKLVNIEKEEPIREYYARQVESDITSINSKIQAQHQKLVTEIDKLKEKALEYKYKNNDAYFLLDALKERIEVMDYSSEDDSISETPTDIPSLSTFIPLN